uniref:coiled-coil domain-containing protein 114 isoform X3 n=2 Tax=Epinephelus lanceolatus TaxID=310571 RepID=UPI0014482251|nr:coiled-coil domain-containing protein 114 isoform X3 [Epinephelus lanceolatus]
MKTSITMPRGRSATSARSDSSELDIDESEIAKLQRQFRIMEGDRQAYSIQAREQIRKQQQEIENLLKEQKELHRNLGACKSVSRQQQDSEDTRSLRALLEQRDMIEEELDKERQCQKELEKEIANMEMKLAGLRKGEISTGDRQKSELGRTQKAIRTLEYKLNRALTRFNEQLTKNSHLREEMQILHIERARFLQLHNRLDKELQDVRKKIGEIVNLSTAAYDARVEAQSKMTMMKEKAVKDLAQYNAEMKELERVIAHECSLKEFMTTKCSERSGQDDGHEMGHRQLSALKEQRRMDSGEESLDALEEVFNKIQTVTGEDNLDLLVTRFIQVEDRNFALFNFVNEQNNEAEALRDQISQIQAEIEQFRVAGLQQEQNHRSLLRDIDEQQKAAESQAEDYENQASIISKILEEIRTGVNSIFSKMECDSSVIEDNLGSSSGVSENNIMSYLGLVEQKTNELLTIQAFLNSKDLEKDYNPKDLAKFLLGQNPDLLQQNVTIQPTISSVEYDAEESPVTDEEEWPLSQEELRRRILKGVLQKESSVRQAATKTSKTSQQVDGRQRSLEDALI